MAKAAVKKSTLRNKAKKTPQQKRMTLRNKADHVFSKIVRLRDGSCVADRDWEAFECAGLLQCAHVWGRRYHSVRFDERNAVALCQAHHLYFTQRPFEWYEFMEERLGRKAYVLLREQALFGQTPDYDEVIPRLQARLEELSDGLP